MVYRDLPDVQHFVWTMKWLMVMWEFKILVEITEK